MKVQFSNPMDKITESESNYYNLEDMPVGEILQNINSEDQLVAIAVKNIIPEIENFIQSALIKMKLGGRLFYIGAGTSGRLGILDASECPPTFGVEQGKVIGLIAGGDQAIRKAVEGAEDEFDGGWKDLLQYDISENDVLVGIAASGSTPYVLGAIKMAKERNILTAGITSNIGSKLATSVDHPLVVQVGPEFLTGSTRMKSGTAQKMILNMLSTSLMIGLGHVKGNKMVDMQLSNQKLIHRGTLMVMKETGLNFEESQKLLLAQGSVRKAIAIHNS